MFLEELYNWAWSTIFCYSDLNNILNVAEKKSLLVDITTMLNSISERTFPSCMSYYAMWSLVSDPEHRVTSLVGVYTGPVSPCPAHSEAPIPECLARPWSDQRLLSVLIPDTMSLESLETLSSDHVGNIGRQRSRRVSGLSNKCRYLNPQDRREV